MSDQDFLSAALRHTRDAERMQSDADTLSLDQAWHLAGVAIECARKAGIQSEWFWKLLGHSFSTTAEEIVDLAIALDPAASRRPLRAWSITYPSVRDWSPEHRYERTGTRLARSVDQLVQQSRKACSSISVALILDGTMNAEALR